MNETTLKLNKTISAPLAKPVEPEYIEEYDYEPQSAIAIPPMPDQDEYIYRWLRYRKGAEDDYVYVSSKLREGWKFVDAGDLPDGYYTASLESKINKLAGTATNGDLVLAKIPRKRAAQIRHAAEEQAFRMGQAVDARQLKVKVDGHMHEIHNSNISVARTGRQARFD